MRDIDRLLILLARTFRRSQSKMLEVGIEGIFVRMDNPSRLVALGELNQPYLFLDSVYEIKDSIFGSQSSERKHKR